MCAALGDVLEVHLQHGLVEDLRVAAEERDAPAAPPMCPVVATNIIFCGRSAFGTPAQWCACARTCAIRSRPRPPTPTARRGASRPSPSARTSAGSSPTTLLDATSLRSGLHPDPGLGRARGHRGREALAGALDRSTPREVDVLAGVRRVVLVDAEPVEDADQPDAAAAVVGPKKSANRSPLRMPNGIGCRSVVDPLLRRDHLERLLGEHALRDLLEVVVHHADQPVMSLDPSSGTAVAVRFDVRVRVREREAVDRRLLRRRRVGPPGDRASLRLPPVHRTGSRWTFFRPAASNWSSIHAAAWLSAG